MLQPQQADKGPVGIGRGLPDWPHAVYFAFPQQKPFD